MVLVCGGLILLIAIGTRQSFGLFLQPMSTDLGWGRETFSFAIALQNLVWGLAMPLAGAIADRFGAARIMFVGGIAYALGLWAMAHSQGALAFDLSAGLLTESEDRVARLVQRGMRNREIAAALHYRPRSVEVYLSRIYAKTGCASRVDLVREMESGAVELPA